MPELNDNIVELRKAYEVLENLLKSNHRMFSLKSKEKDPNSLTKITQRILVWQRGENKGLLVAEQGQPDSIGALMIIPPSSRGIYFPKSPPP